jgi:3D (Asp-Asp-Asp) domain-containing protein
MGLFVLTAPQVGWAAGNTASSVSAPPPPSYQLTLTGYNAVVGQTDDDPFTTASGAYSNPDIVAARSVDLADELPFGTVIEIAPAATSSPMCGYSLVQGQIGLRVIADSMNPKMHNKVDVLFHSDTPVNIGGKKINAARALGLCPGVQVTVVGHIDIDKIPQTQEALKTMLGTGSLAVAQ